MSIYFQSPFEKSESLFVSWIICLQNAGIVNPCIMLRIIPLPHPYAETYQNSDMKQCRRFLHSCKDTELVLCTDFLTTKSLDTI